MPKFVINGKRILEMCEGNARNAHQIGLKVGISAMTANKYLEHPEKVEVIDARVLAGLLIVGAGMTKEQVLNMRLGDVFEIEE